MSDPRPELDLGSLSRGTQELEPPRRRWLRLVLPAGILLIFAAVLLSSLGDLLRRGIEVRVVTPRPVPQGSAVAAPRDRVLVQAAGWVEPDPSLVHVTALSGGIVTEVLVQESDIVQAGDPVARLVDDDARLALARAAAELALARANVEDATARSSIAQERFDAALGVREAAAVAVADAKGRAAEAKHRRAALVGAEVNVRIAKDELAVQKELFGQGAAGSWQVELAEGAVAAAESSLAVLRADAALADAEVEGALAREERAKDELRLRFEDRLERDRAAAALAAATATAALSEAKMAEAELELERKVVRTPVSGVVLERLTVPGMVLDLNRSGHEVCSLYDPKSLRVRVDVPQDDIDRLFVGQRAEIVTNARTDEPYAGELIRLVQLADIQKVTLEAQVRIDGGDSLLRPDMLAQVRFFGSGEAPAGGSGDSSAAGAFLIPRRLVEDGAVWVLDPVESVAVRRKLTLGAERGEDIEVLDHIDATTKILDSGATPLTEGVGVKVKRGGA